MSTSGSDVPAADVLSGPDVAPLVVRGGIQRSAGFVAVNLITVAAAVLLLRYLGVQDFGRYGTVMAVLAIVQGISDAGLSMTGSRELSVRTAPEERRVLLAHLLGLRILLSAAGVVAAIGFALVAGYDRELVIGTAVAGAGVLILSVQAAMLLPLVVELRNGRLTLNEVLRQFVLVLSFAALALTGAELGAFFAAQLATALVLLACTPLLLQRHNLVRPSWSRGQLQALLLTTLPLAISAVLSVLYFRILVILVSLLEDSPTEVGYYVTSTRIVETFLALPVTLVGIVLPVLSVAARDDVGRLRYVTLRLTQVLALLGLLSALGLGIGAEAVVRILGGAQYAGAVPVLQIQCAALVTIFMAGGWTTTLVSMERTRALAAGTGFGVFAVATLGLLLIPPYGAEGGAAAAVLGDVAFSLFILVALRRAGPGRGLPVGPFARLGGAAAATLALALVLPLPALVEGIGAGVLFPALALLLGAVPEELEARILPRRGR